MDEPLMIELSDIDSVLRDLTASLVTEIKQLSDSDILHRDADQLFQTYLSKYEVEVPFWEEDQIRVDKPETVDVDVTPEVERWNKNGVDRWETGRVIKFRVPLVGNRAVIDRFVRLKGDIADGRKRAFFSEGVLELRYTRLDHDAPALMADVHKDLDNLRTKLETLHASAIEYNAQLSPLIEDHLGQRRSRAEADLTLASSLGYPLMERADTLVNEIVPVDPQRISIVNQSPIPSGLESSPPQSETIDLQRVLPNEDYDHILTLLRHMSVVFERSPTVAQELNEEAIQTLFLVILNSHFSGEVTGETFNHWGKTDILIRVGENNVFIAECKIWKGEAQIEETVKQLFHYITWRDTKTAILYFVKNDTIDGISDKIATRLKLMPEAKEVLSSDDRELRCMFKHPRTENGEFRITVQLYHIPPRNAPKVVEDGSLISGTQLTS